MKFALLQLHTGVDASVNVNRAIECIKLVKAKNPDLKVVILPECFTGPFGVQNFQIYAERFPLGSTYNILGSLASALDLYIIGGSIIDVDDGGKLFNTCPVWDPNGLLRAKYRKIHLHDVHMAPDKGGDFLESSVITPGDQLTTIEIDNHKIGIGIGSDIRFEEMARSYRLLGCEMIVYPAVFNIPTGQFFWEVLQRGRAVDNQLFVALVSPSRNVDAEFVAYGHSMMVDPWGKVLAEAGEKQEFVIVDVDFSVVDEVRQQMPLLEQRRSNLYMRGDW